jgi:hypothetical protein
MLSFVRRLSFDAAAEFVDAPGAKWFTTPLNCPHSHPTRNCPHMSSAINQLIAGAPVAAAVTKQPRPPHAISAGPVGRLRPGTSPPGTSRSVSPWHNSTPAL